MTAASSTGARSVMGAVRRWGIWIAAGVLALLAYVPALMSSPGRMPADTKLYLYLDPDRLISDAPFTFDGRQFAGWVPHQVIAYLWPQGPWYSLGNAAAVPDWIVHRLWIGTLFVAAGTGVLWLARRLGLGVVAAFAAAAVYQLSPYVLPYVSRTSAMLLPWAGLGWIVGLTVLAATRSRWRHAALCALVVATVGAVNATALLMVAPAPVLWLLVAAAERRIGWGRAAATAVKVGVLSLAVSLWWIAAVVIQGRRGAPVLAYSESLEAVSHTSTAPEVWRGLGYWLTYVRDPYAATTTAGQEYLGSGRLIVFGYALIAIGLLGLVLVRWRERRFGVALVVTGVVLGAGVHPLGDPSPLMDLLAGDGESGLALALRSSTRAAPMLVLGLALGSAALIDGLGGLRAAAARWLRPLAAAAVVLIAILNLPVLTGHRLVDPALERDQDPPAAWLEAAADLDADLDAQPGGGRVLQLPGAEFGAFRWGYTVDPPLPGLTERPLVTRDLLPLGSPAAMDLVYALDDRFQSGVVEPASLAPIARLLGADTIWVTGDAAFDRFRTPRPELVHELFAAVPGLGRPEAYGLDAASLPLVPMVDEQAVSDPRIGTPVPPVELVPVDDAIGVVRVKDREVLVAGSGDGLVDAAAAGLIDGSELVRYSASLGDAELLRAVADADAVVVTDTNRDRAHHWRSSQDVVGLTEDGDPSQPDVLERDAADERLPVFDTDDVAAATIAVQEGPVVARATAYGEPFAYRPEARAAMAVDGDPATAWVVGEHADPVGERLELTIAEPIDHVDLLLPAIDGQHGAATARRVGAVSIAVDGGPAQAVVLDEQALEGRGQRVELEPTTGPSTLTVTIDSVAVPDTAPASLGPVGFAEVDVGLGPTVEVVRVPTDALTALRDEPATPVSYVFTRHRTRPTDRWRSDPEPVLRREFVVPGDRVLTPQVTVRLDQRAADVVLAELLGVQGAVAGSRLTGVSAAAGWAATDGDASTAWITPFESAVGSVLDVTLDGPLAGDLTITQRAGDFSPVTALRLTSGDSSVDVEVPPPGPDGSSVVTLPDELPGPDLTVEITEIEARTTTDRRYADTVVLPAAIAELSAGSRTVVPAAVDTGCRDDLLTVDGDPVPLQVTAPVADLLAGTPVEAVACDGDLRLDDGPHRLEAAGGTGLQVDRVVLPEDGASPAVAPSRDAPTLELRSSDRTSRTALVEGCPDGCWLVLGEGYNEAWSATATAAGGQRDLGPPQLVDGGFNGWRLPPTEGPVEVTMRWDAQGPQTIALLASAVAVVACGALAALDRRRTAIVSSDPPPPTIDLGEDPVPLRMRWIAAATWVVLAALLVGPGYAVVAALAAGLLIVVAGRPRLAGFVALGLVLAIALVVLVVVRRERPPTDASWPVRFERWHRPALFAAVSLLISAFARRPTNAGP